MINDLRVIKELQKELQGIVEGLANSLNADVVTLWLYDADTDEFGLPIRYGVRSSRLLFDPIFRPVTNLGGDLIVDKKEAIIANDIANTILDGSFTSREEITSSACFPVIYHNQVLGVLFVSYRHPHIFSKNIQEMIAEAAEKTASIITKSQGNRLAPSVAITPN